MTEAEPVDQRPANRTAAARLKSRLLLELSGTIQDRGLSQSAAAGLIGVDQPTLSKALSGRLRSVTIDRLLGWLEALDANFDLAPVSSNSGPDQRRSRIIEQASHVCIWERNLVTGDNYWSDAAYDLYGWPRDRRPPSYDEWLALLHPEDRAKLSEARTILSLERPGYENEFRIVRADGQIRWVLNRAVAEFDNSGRPVCLYGANIDITERRRAEVALRDSEAMLRLVARVGRVGHFSWDPRTAEATCSREYREIYGLPADRERLDFHAWVELIHPDDRTQVLASIEAATKDGALVEGEHRIIRADTGEVRWVLNRSEIERDSLGNVSRVVGAQFDITEQKASEARAQANEARLRMAQRAAQAVTWDYDVGSGVTYWSDLETLHEIAGAPLGAATRLRDWVAIIHEDDKAPYFDQWSQCFAAGEGRIEFRIRRGGEIRWLEVFARVIERDAGGVPKRLIGISTDITLRRNLADSLQASEQRLRLAVEAGRMAIFDHEIATDRFSHSAELNRMLELPPGDLSIDQVRAHYAPGEMDRLRQARAEAIARGDRFIEAEFQMIASTGEPRWFLMRAETHADQQGHAFRTSGVLLEITERKQAEKHQRLLIDELNHRTKNQLAIIQGIAQQTLKGSGISDQAQQAFEGRLCALSAAHNLLTRRSWASVPLKQLLVDSVAAVAAAERVDLQGPELLLKPKTGVSLAMAVHELATNAVKYGALSTPGGSVQVSWGTVNGYLSLSWRETGGPVVKRPARRGFGSRMIERGLAAELGGRVHIDFAPEGVVCSVNAPLQKVAV